MTVVGLISDTHGLLREEALAALRGSDHILHAGDIGDPEILTRLREIAPLTAVRGNNDVGEGWEIVPETAELNIGGIRILLLHDLKALPALASGYDVIVSGHSHKPQQQRRDGVLYVNPGSAGPRRFSLPVSVGRLSIGARGVSAKLLQLV